MKKRIPYKIVTKLLTEKINHKKKNILEIGCGGKLYKKIFINQNYYGIDKKDSDWVDKEDKPEFICDLKDFKTSLKFEFIFSVATIYLLDKESLNKLVELINNLRLTNGRCLIFDYNRNTINRLGNIYNYYLEILESHFAKNININYHKEWCSNNYFKNFVKEKILISKFNKSLVIDINFNL